jgi:hypothetical protein
MFQSIFNFSVQNTFIPIQISIYFFKVLFTQAYSHSKNASISYVSALCAALSVNNFIKRHLNLQLKNFKANGLKNTRKSNVKKICSKLEYAFHFSLYCFSASYSIPQCIISSPNILSKRPSQGRAIAQAVSRLLPTTTARVQTRV